MNEELQEPSLNFADLVAGIVSAYVANNPLPPAELPPLIARVREAVAGLTTAGSASAAAPNAEIEKPTPVQIRKSVRPDGIVSFIDGKTYKTLKRHLTSHGLDPRSYRDRYGRPITRWSPRATPSSAPPSPGPSVWGAPVPWLHA